MPQSDPKQSIAELIETGKSLLDSEPQRALKLLRRAQALAGRRNDQGALMRALFAEAYYHQRYSDAERSLRLLRETLPMVEEWGTPEERCAVYHMLAKESRSAGKDRDAAAWYAKSLQCAESAGNTRYQTLAWQGLGLLAKAAGRSEEALMLLQRALGLAQSADNAVNQITCLQNIANVQQRAGRLAEAAASLNEAYRLALQTGELRFQASLLYTMGSLAMHQGQRSTAIGKLREALQLFRQLGDSQNQCASIYNIAILLFLDRQYRAALELLAKEIELCRSAGTRRHEAYARSLIAEIHMAEGRYQQAAASLEQCAALSEDVNDATLSAIRERLGLIAELRRTDLQLADARVQETIDRFEVSDQQLSVVLLLIDYADLLEQRDQHRHSIAVLTTALARAQKAPFIDKIIEIHGRLHKLHEAGGNQRLAVLHMEAALKHQQNIAAEERLTLLQHAVLQEEINLAGEVAGPQQPVSASEAEKRLHSILNAQQPQLTLMEMKVSLLVFRNYQSKEIAAALRISHRTVEWHRSNIRHKLAIGPGRSLRATLLQLSA